MLGAKLNISRQSISKWEVGLSFPSIIYLYKLIEILACTLDELLIGVER